MLSFINCDLNVNNPNSPTDADVKSYSGLSLIGVGLQQRLSQAISTHALYTGCVSGELSPVIGYLHLQQLRKYPDASEREEYTYQNDHSRLAWRERYNAIKSANDIVDNVETVKMDQKTRNGLTALAKIGKALSFYYLITEWEKIAINTNVDHPSFVNRETVIEESLELLSDAQEKSKDVSESFIEDVLATGMDLYNLSLALQARFYLMKGDYEKAANKADKVTEEAYFVYNEQNRNPFFNNCIASDFFEALAYWVEEAEKGDSRVNAMVDTSTRAGHFGSDTTYLINKYNSPSDIIPIYTLDEMTLIKAEAYARGGGGNAINEINKIRSSAGLSDYEGDSILGEIFKQRFYELFLTGEHWEDLRRFKNDGIPLVDELRNRELYHEWYLYPDSEADENPNVPAQPTDINYGYSN